MRGSITTFDILRHPVLIVRNWGAGPYLRCLCAIVSRRPRTFLGTLYPAPARSR